MKKITTTLLLLVNLIAYGQVYIDADYTGTEAGTEAQPYNSLDDVSWNANTTYYLKRGTEYYITSQINFNNDNTTLDAYGTGDKPLIWTDQRIRMWVSGAVENPQLRNIRFENRVDPSCYNETPNMINFNGCNNGMAYHIETHGGGRGICSANNTGLLIIRGCLVEETDDDGTWLYKPRHVWVDSTTYRGINRGNNLSCATMTGGDCVQLAGGAFGDNNTSLTITNSTLDRRPYDYKFNVMVGSYSGNEIDWPSVFIENCHLIHSGVDGSNIYINEVDSLVIDRSILEGNRNGIYKGYDFATDIIITRSIFANHSNYHLWLQMNGSKLTSEQVVIRNSAFDNVPTVIVPYAYPVNIENTIISNVQNDVYYGNTNNHSGNYNLYYNVNGNYDNTEPNSVYGQDPLFVSASNYRLQFGSPAIDSGTAQTIGTTDRDGHIVSDENWDIGAYEYGGAVDQCDTSTLSVSGTSTNENDGDASGAVNATITGGSPSYSYVWSSGEITEDISGKSAGTYTLTVTDNNTCTVSKSFTIVNVAPPAVINQLQNEIVVDTVTATDDDGNGPLNTIDRDRSTRFSSNLYGVEVVYTLSDTARIDTLMLSPLNASIRITYFDIAFSLNNISYKPPKSRETSLTTDTVQVFTFSDTAKYVRLRFYGNSENEWSSIQEVYFLGDTVTVTGQPSPCVGYNINLSGVVTDAVNDENGKIDITATSPGSSIFTYNWSTGATTQDLTGLNSGTYSVTITDENECTQESEFVVNCVGCIVWKKAIPIIIN